MRREQPDVEPRGPIRRAAWRSSRGCAQFVMAELAKPTSSTRLDNVREAKIEQSDETVTKPKVGAAVGHYGCCFLSLVCYGTAASTLIYAVPGGERMRKIHLALVAFARFVLVGYALAQQAPARVRPVPTNLPEWAWGVMPPAPPPQPGAAPATPPADDVTIRDMERSSVG